MSNKNLPIKVVMQRGEDIVKNLGNGRVKFFGEVTEELQKKLVNEMDKLKSYYTDFFQENPNVPAVAKITMKEEAMAKSHKPNNFCQNLPIIGSGKLDEIFIRISPEGIRKTKENLNTLPSERFKANITAIDSIDYITPNDVLSDELKTYFSETKNIDEGIIIKIRPFEFVDIFDKNNFDIYFKKKIEDLNIDYKEYSYDSSLHFYTMKIKNRESLEKLSSIVGVRHISPISYFSMLNDNLDEIGLNNITFSDEVLESETIIGIVDSGISSDSIMNDFVYDRITYVPEPYQNRNHGTFVSSIIQFGDYLNGFESEVNKKYRFLDAIVIPNSDPNRGKVGTLSEDDFMDIMIDLLERYHDKVKVWNLSLGTDIKVSEGISDLAVFLDYLQDYYQVQIFLAAGNINDLSKLKTWDNRISLKNDEERITVPSDSVRAITVGSIAKNDSDESLSKENDPSPFTRCGPGANYNLKPDIVDYGGNMRIDGGYQNIGTTGIGTDSKLIENIGTSFSTPRGTKKFVDIFDDLEEKDLLLAKALLIHSARVNSKNLKLKSEKHRHYYGYGLPFEKHHDVLQCSENEVTLMFSQSVIPKIHLEMNPFPFPENLLDEDKYKGEVFMTLVYSPPLDQKYGLEYCRTNVDVSFGQYDIDSEGAPYDYKGEVPLEKKWTEKFEKAQVENGLKWAPIKSYYRKMTSLSQKEAWKVRVDLTPRNEQIPQEQEFILIMTIRDLSSDSDIYSEIVNGLRSEGYILNDLQTRLRTRIDFNN